MRMVRRIQFGNTLENRSHVQNPEYENRSQLGIGDYWSQVSKTEYENRSHMQEIECVIPDQTSRVYDGIPDYKTQVRNTYLSRILEYTIVYLSNKVR